MAVRLGQEVPAAARSKLKQFSTVKQLSVKASMTLALSAEFRSQDRQPIARFTR
ncbi:MAG: hypothetical protein F6K28_58195 [Microcoleus sp. SIO2G3]|nr:hypothetical protein [Microcoleus sp. SIO2G3]